VTRRTPLWLGIALLLIAFNLRTPITSVGPVLDDIRDGVGLSGASAGLLTTLPVLCFCVVGALVPALARRVGEEPALLIGMLVLAVGAALRLDPAVAPLFAGTLLAGVGIAVANVLLPAVIKHDYDRPGTMMGLYTAVLSGSAALAAALTVPLEHGVGSWNRAVALWAIPALAAALAWTPVVLRARRARHAAPPAAPPARVRLRGDRLAWLLTGLFAFQSTLFYMSVAWIPDLLRDGGMSDGRAGAMLGLALLLGIPTALLLPMLAGRAHDQRALVLIPFVTWGAAILGLLLDPTGLTPLWMVLVGLGQGAGFSLTLTLVVLRAPDGPHTTALSGMVQALGYAVAGCGPFVLGVIHDVTGGWSVPLITMLGLCVAMLACGLGAGRPGLVRGRPVSDLR
jgi:CP family cyanate transporter-like MFS transporter